MQQEPAPEAHEEPVAATQPYEPEEPAEKENPEPVSFLTLFTFVGDP